MKEYNEGAAHRQMGYSKHYNPYRNRGTAQQYTDWLDGWKSFGVDFAGY